MTHEKVPVQKDLSVLSKTLHPAFIFIETSCLVLFSIAFVCPRYLKLVNFSICILLICMLTVVSIFAINLVFPFCILSLMFKLYSFMYLLN